MRNIQAKFGVYTLRTATEQDRPMLTEWIDQDPFHRLTMKPEYFMGLREQGTGWVADSRPNCLVIEDERGAVMFVRLSRAARVQIQFMPITGQFNPRARTAAALVQGMRFLEIGLARAGAEEWIFNTGNPALEALAKVRLGFTASPHEWVRGIGYLAPRHKQEEASAPQEGGT